MFEINLRISPPQHIAVEAVLEELGATSISLCEAVDEPVFVQAVDEMPLWKQITLSALFNEQIELDYLRNTLEDILNCPIEISIQAIDEQDWQQSYMQTIQPTQFGKRLWICPSWCTSPDPFAINIRLDPGLAFGTGAHPTTALCLEWLANHPPSDQSVIDFGCGSGILAIAAYYLGAKSILAVDHDPQAIQATYANASCNHLFNNKLKIVSANNLRSAACDVLIANVLLQPLVKLKQDFAHAVLPAGKIILSGILPPQLGELTQAYQTSFDIDQIYSKNEWLLIEATRH